MASKWSENLTKADGWTTLTHKAAAKVQKALHLSTGVTIEQHSTSTFLVKVKQDTSVPLEFTVDLNNHSSPCSCAYLKDMKAPCIHILLCLQTTNRLAEMEVFFTCAGRKKRSRKRMVKKVIEKFFPWS